MKENPTYNPWPRRITPEDRQKMRRASDLHLAALKLVKSRPDITAVEFAESLDRFRQGDSLYLRQLVHDIDWALEVLPAPESHLMAVSRARELLVSTGFMSERS